ncbi:MAG: sugar transporter, partial [Flavobacterium sp.]|nr:sugar transporter [Flavobacterium sp.]
MLDTKDFNFFESQNTFDFKGFLLKVISYWKWFLLSLIITFVYAYNVNIRKEKIYGMESLIVVEDQNNPFFTSNTSLVFNWGGTSDKVQTIITTLKSRSHNEIVVDRLQYYIKYLRKGEYFFQDVYGEVPFYVEIDKTKGQLFKQLIKIKFLSPTQYELSVDFGEATSAKTMQYSDLVSQPVNVSGGVFKKNYKINEEVALPFLNLKVIIKPEAYEYTNQEYYVRFDDFNSTVATYKGIDVSADAKALSVVRLQMEGSNKYRLVEYLNTTVDVLRKIQLESKNQFANNTIGFIDSTLREMEGQIKEAENELKEFRRGKNIFELDEEGGSGLLSSKLSAYDVEKDGINRKIAYYN